MGPQTAQQRGTIPRNYSHESRLIRRSKESASRPAPVPPWRGFFHYRARAASRCYSVTEYANVNFEMIRIVNLNLF